MGSEFVCPAAVLTEEALAFLTSIDSPTIANAIETLSPRDRTDGFLGGAIRALYGDVGVMVGQALTVKVDNQPGPIAGRDGFWAMFEALAEMPSPSVIVMQDVSGRPTRCAYAGEVMATMAQRLGAVGMVTDGGYRDVEEVRALGMHYYATCHVVAHGNFEIRDVGEPVTLDGQDVKTGDLLHGDINGIVVVPPEVLDRLPAAVATIRDRERRLMDFIRGDAFSLEAARAGRGY